MTDNNKIIVIWLAAVCALVYLMIVVGGVTRLTQSGLSMVDWRPIMGILPPVTEEDWRSTFDAYKQYPEYQEINRGMSLLSFKRIFYWEYSHRLLGRLIALVYFLPFVVLLAQRRIEGRWVPRLWVGLVLGGVQGLMGWYMVQSGLVDVPHVSHYRLAAHLLLAIFILAFLFWLILDIMQVSRRAVSLRLRWSAVVLLVLLAFQLLFGAFTAGLDAGFGFNTWPLMHGQFLADAATMMNPLWLNIIENGVMMQFIHRWLGALLLLCVVLLAVSLLRNEVLKRAALLLLAITAVQFVLGVAALMLKTPVMLGSLHQAVACLMVLSLVYLVYMTSASGNS